MNFKQVCPVHQFNAAPINFLSVSLVVSSFFSGRPMGLFTSPMGKYIFPVDQSFSSPNNVKYLFQKDSLILLCQLKLYL
jgi:hypothetical protein